MKFLFLASGPIVILLLFHRSSGLTSPGPCPSKPPTYIVPNNSMSEYQILFVVPFTSDTSKSYLFTRIPLQEGICYNIIHTTESLLLLNLPVSYENRDTDLDKTHVRSNIIGEKDSLTMNSNFFETDNSPLRCHKAIQEQVRIWIHEPVALLWHCHEFDKKHHDEALIVAVIKLKEGIRVETDNKKLVRQSFEEDRGKIEEIVRSFAGSELMNQISWPIFVNSSWTEEICSDIPNLYSCPRRRTTNVLLLLLFAAILICLRVIWKVGNMLWNWNICNNRIEPD